MYAAVFKENATFFIQFPDGFFEILFAAVEYGFYLVGRR